MEPAPLPGKHNDHKNQLLVYTTEQNVLQNIIVIVEACHSQIEQGSDQRKITKGTKVPINEITVPST